MVRVGVITRGLLLASVALSPGLAMAQVGTEQYWDGPDVVADGVVDGGTGTWNNTLTNWTTVDGSVNAPWAGDGAVFGGLAGTVTLGEAVTVRRLRFLTDGYVITSTSGRALLTSGFVPITVDAGLTATVNAPINGTGQLVVSGPGTLVLGGASQYSGGTVVQSGVLGVTRSGALGTGLASFANGTTLRGVGVNETLANPFEALGAFTVEVENRIALTGGISGAGTLTKRGGGTLTIGGVNSLGGGVVIDGGTVAVASDAALGAAGVALTFSGVGGRLQGLASFATDRGVVLDAPGTLAPDAGTVLTLNGVVSGAGELTKASDGRLVLNAANTHAGGTSLVRGTLALGNAQALGTGTLSANGGDLAAAADGLTIGNAIVINSALDIDSGPGSLTLAGSIGGVGGLTKAGAGQLNLTGANSQLGTTRVNAGAVGVGSNGALGQAGAALANGTTLRVLADGLTIDVNIAVTGTATIDTGAFTLTVTNGPSGEGALTKVGAGTLVLTEAGNTRGGFTLAEGRVDIAAGGAFGSAGEVGFAGGTTLGLLANSLDVNRPANLFGGTLTIDTNGFDVRFNGIIRGPGGIAIGEATPTTLIEFQGANTFSGGIAAATGRLTARSDSAFGTGALTLGDGASIAFGVQGLTVGNAVNATGTLFLEGQVRGVSTLSGQIAGAARVVKVGEGVIELTGANSYTGGVLVAEGTLRGNTASLVGDIQNDAALVFNQGFDGTFTSAIRGSGSLGKTGAGTLTLAGETAGVAGPTSVTGGVLSVLGSLAGSDVTVGAGGAFAGATTVRSLLVLNGGTLRPGALGGAPGTLTVLTDLGLRGGATTVFDLAPVARGEIGVSDLIVAGGIAQLGGTAVLLPTAPVSQYRFGALYRIVRSDAALNPPPADPTLPPLPTPVNGNFATIDATAFGPAFAPTTIRNGSRDPAQPDELFVRLDPNSFERLLTGRDPSDNVLAVARGNDAAIANFGSGNGAAELDPELLRPFFLLGDGLNAGLNQLTGEITPVTRRVALDDSRFAREAALDRLCAGLSVVTGGDRTGGACQATKRFQVWGRGVAAFGKTSSDGNGARQSRDTVGAQLGAEMLLADGVYRFGALGSYTTTDVSLGDNLGQGKVETLSAGVYAGASFGPIGIRAGGSIGQVEFDTRRQITVPGAEQRLVASPSGRLGQLFIDVGFSQTLGRSALVEPFLRVATVTLRARGFTETGGPLTLNELRQNYTQTITVLGARGHYTLGDKLFAKGSLGYRVVGGDRSPTAFENFPGGIRGVGVDQSAAAVEALVETRLGGVRLDGGYSGVIGARNQDHGAKVTATIGF